MRTFTSLFCIEKFDLVSESLFKCMKQGSVMLGIHKAATHTDFISIQIFYPKNFGNIYRFFSP